MGIKVVPTKKSSQSNQKKSSTKSPQKKGADVQPKISIMPGQKSEADWQAEEDVRTLMRAEEIKANAKRFAKAKEEARKQAARVSRIVK